jgi:hypothetical protein
MKLEHMYTTTHGMCVSELGTHHLNSSIFVIVFHSSFFHRSSKFIVNCNRRKKITKQYSSSSS